MQTNSLAFSQENTAYKVINRLSTLRRTNDAVAYGTAELLYSNADVMVMKR